MNVNERCIEEQLDSVFNIPLHSVTISGRGKSLKDVFMSDNSCFSKVNGKSIVEIRAGILCYAPGCFMIILRLGV